MGELTKQAARISQDLIAKSERALAASYDPLVSGWSEADKRFHEDRIARLTDKPSTNNVAHATFAHIKRAA
jgi:hypothetical protein